MTVSKRTYGVGKRSEQWVLVLGCSSGTGAAVCRAAADAGYNVYGCHRGRHQEGADAIEAYVTIRGRRVIIRKGDAAGNDLVQAAAQDIRAQIGPNKVVLIVHAIANASLGQFVSKGAMGRIQPHQFQKTFDCMAHSFAYWGQAAVDEELLAPGGMLLGLTNPFTNQVTNQFGLIAAAKAALTMYVRYLAYEMAPLGYRVNLLNFGLVETAAMRLTLPDELWNLVHDRIARVTPYGRIANCDEVAAFIVTLLEQPAHWFNGAVIDFTGGQTDSLLSRYFNEPAGTTL